MMKIMSIALLCLALLLLPNADSSTVPVSGISETQLDAYLYESYTTLLYNFSLPTNFDQEALTFQPYVSKFQSAHGFCNRTEFGNQCPQLYYLNKLLKYTFPVYFQQVFGTVSNTSLSFIHSDFDKIGPHFGGIVSSSPALLQEYIKKLQASELYGTIIERPNISRDIRQFYTNFSMNTGRIYDQMLKDTLSEFVATQNVHQSAYSLFLLNLHLENTKLKETVARCQAGNIPKTLVPVSELRNQLISNKALEPKDYKLTIPASAAEAYYQLPVADCTFIDKTHLLVRIQVPVASTAQNDKLIRLDAIPFLRESEICFVSQIQNKVLLVQNSKYFSESSCKAGELCKVPKYGGSWDFSFNPCISAFLENSNEEIQKHCKLDCIPFESTVPVFKRISSDRLILTASATATPFPVFLHCNGKPTKVIKPAPEGALDLTVPCDCDIVYNSKAVFKASQPCTSEFKARPITPFAWTATAEAEAVTPENFTGGGENPEHTTDSDNLDHCCNNDSSTTLYTLAFIILILITVVLILLVVFILKVIRLEQRVEKPLSSISFANNIYDEPRLLYNN